MLSSEERLAYLEGQVSDHAPALSDVRESIRHVEHQMVTLFDRVERRFEAVDRRFEIIDRRFEAIDRRFEVIDRRFEAIDRRFDAIDRRFETVDRRLDGLDQKVSRQFVWLVGFQLTTLIAVVGALLART